MTIDRIIFLRICRGRGIEPLRALSGATERSPKFTRACCSSTSAADERYNPGCSISARKRADWSARSADPKAGDRRQAAQGHPKQPVLPRQPLRFSVLPADILGQVYEQFLGKVIRLTDGHRAVVEDKPEVKKAGGVYYTPTYIVDYIVKHTLGELLEGRKHGEEGIGSGEPLHIVDPACGSGSFLLGAYQYLLDWYRDGYIANDPQKWAKGAKPRLVQMTTPNSLLPAMY